MDLPSLENDVVSDLSPFYMIHKDGKIERLMGTETVPATPEGDPETGVRSKDVVIASETGVAARIFLPKTDACDRRLPILIYFHGGAFFVQSAFSPTYMVFLNSLANQAGIIIVSVDYRLAPEHPLPVAYDDCWSAVKWVFSNSSGEGGEPWLTNLGDFTRVFLAGDSAGANIAHQMGMRVGSGGANKIGTVSGIVMMHPYFWGKDPIGAEKDSMKTKEYVDKLWVSACPTSTGSDDPWVNPVLDPDLSRLGCGRVLVFVSEKDVLKDRGWFYGEALKRSGWGGEVEILEVEGEEHVFHLEKPNCKKAKEMVEKAVGFINK